MQVTLVFVETESRLSVYNLEVDEQMFDKLRLAHGHIGGQGLLDEELEKFICLELPGYLDSQTPIYTDDRHYDDLTPTCVSITGTLIVVEVI